MRKLEDFSNVWHSNKTEQNEGLHLLIPLITSSFLRCVPIFQCTSVSFAFSHSLAGLQVVFVSPSCSYRSSVCQILLLQVLCVPASCTVLFPSSHVSIPALAPPDLLTKNDTECVVCHQNLQFTTSKLPEHIQIGSFLPHIHLFDANSLLMSTRLLKWILYRKCLFLFYV